MHITAKPTSFNCNLKCKYCFYLEKENYYQDAKLMDLETLEEFIKSYIIISSNEVYFTWQGGEPTLAGLTYFEKVIELQEKYKGNKTIKNSIQTNGVLINEKWCLFLHKHNFLVGISIDGPKEIHDKYRVNNANRGTFDKVMNAINLFKKHKVDFNTLTVINNINVQQPLVVYNFLKDIGSTHIQFIELLETRELDDNFIPIWMSDDVSNADVMDFSSPSVSYGRFMKTVFRTWVEKDVGTIYIRQFETFLNRFAGNKHTVCIFQETCGDNLVIESNGDIYECDHYVYPTHYIGSVHSQLLPSYHGNKVDSAKQQLSDKCKKCMYLEICNGGCPKHRIIKTSTGNVSYFCDGYKIFFAEITPYMNAMRQLITDGVPAYHIMQFVPQIRKNLHE